jgi:hypothetical protein
VEPQAGPFSAESQSPDATAREGRAVSKRKITHISGAIDWCVVGTLLYSSSSLSSSVLMVTDFVVRLACACISRHARSVSAARAPRTSPAGAAQRSGVYMLKPCRDARRCVGFGLSRRSRGAARRGCLCPGRLRARKVSSSEASGRRARSRSTRQ